jgi:aminoglycoside phosphotransferase (APT) family kinase protein
MHTLRLMTQPPIDQALVQRLLAAQFPLWAGLPVRAVVPGGWDNRTFRVGEHLLARLPSAASYEAQVDKEQQWLPRLLPRLPLAIPTPVAMGQPGEGYAWKWSICRWIEGSPLLTASRSASLSASLSAPQMQAVAVSLAAFLAALQAIDATGGPAPGAHNFHRGGSLRVYEAQTREAIARLHGRIDTHAALDLWACALASRWSGPGV